MLRFTRLVAAGLIAASSIVAAQEPRLEVLDRLLPGNWTLHEIGSAAPGRSMCISDTSLLLQIHHDASTVCTRFVASAGPRSATIDYTCPGAGHGRTTLNAQSPILVRIQTQGLAGGSPFDMDYEARRGGACVRSGRN